MMQPLTIDVGTAQTAADIDNGTRAQESCRQQQSQVFQNYLWVMCTRWMVARLYNEGASPLLVLVGDVEGREDKEGRLWRQ